MSNTQFNHRVFGCVIVKAINSNYNADFTHQPRTLPDGVAYATDKALKYTIKNYLLNHYPNDNIFYFKRLNDEFNPYDLVGAFEEMFKSTKLKTAEKNQILTNLLSCLDIRLFGATFAPKGEGIKDKNISIHGIVQIGHGVNRYPESVIFSEQIMSPFANKKKSESKDSKEDSAESSKDPSQATLGSQSKLQEGHYVHHFSINPKNLEEHAKRANHNGLSENDIDKLKEAMRSGATYYDSASKAGTENELLFWVQLHKDSKLVLPSFTPLIKVEKKANNESKTVIDFTKVNELLSKPHVKEAIEKIELYYDSVSTEIKGLADIKGINL